MFFQPPWLHFGFNFFLSLSGHTGYKTRNHLTSLTSTGIQAATQSRVPEPTLYPEFSGPYQGPLNSLVLNQMKWKNPRYSTTASFGKHTLSSFRLIQLLLDLLLLTLWLGGFTFQFSCPFPQHSGICCSSVVQEVISNPQNWSKFGNGLFAKDTLTTSFIGKSWRYTPRPGCSFCSRNLHVNISLCNSRYHFDAT